MPYSAAILILTSFHAIRKTFKYCILNSFKFEKNQIEIDHMFGIKPNKIKLFANRIT